MADYWKSQPRKFCQYCKCWIADNKPSVEFHERGKKHKENVTAKISEIKKKSLDKAKQEERSSKEFAAMEEAALKAYEEDLKRMEREAAGLDSPARTTAPAKPPPKPVVVAQTKTQYKKQQKKQQKANVKAVSRSQAEVWVEGQMYDGNKYYYNATTGESRWEKPEGFQGGEGPASVQPEPPESSSGGLWMEAVSPDGYTYYYNSESGESTWEKPASVPSSKASGPDLGGEGQEGPSSRQAEAPLLGGGGEETSNGASASEKVEVPEDAGQQRKVPKISFGKRKAEAEPSGKEGDGAASGTAPKEDDEGTRKEEEVRSEAAEPEEKKGADVIRKKTQARRLKAVNPYGAWEQIKEVVDPYTSVDLQLPQFEGCPVSAPAAPPPEPKPKFRERVITSLGEEGGATSFRKSKTQNGKSRRLRQREEEDD